MLTAEQTIAIGRKYGAHRFSFVCGHDQHDFVKVNSSFDTVKIFLSTRGDASRFRQFVGDETFDSRPSPAVRTHVAPLQDAISDVVVAVRAPPPQLPGRVLPPGGERRTRVRALSIYQRRLPRVRVRRDAGLRQ
jgi:hypothetical protein